jgi:hypothetical protein
MIVGYGSPGGWPNTYASSPTSRIRPEAARLAAEAPVLSESKRRSAPSKRLQPPAGGGSLHLTQGNPKAAQDAKEKAAKSGGAKKGGKSNVTYQEMITRAIVDMNDRHGSSAMAITKWIGQQFPNFDVKRTQVSKKITALVKSGYLARVKSSFKLSASTKDAMRKAKEQKRKGKDKGKGPKLKSTMDSSLERRSRVLKYLGMLPLVSNAWAYEETTLPLPAAAYEPVPKDMLPRPPPRSRSISRSQSPGKSSKLKRVGVEGGQGQGASASGGGGVSPSASSSSSGGGAGRPRPSSLLTRNGDVRIPRSKSALNYFQDSVRASYRRAHPGIGMPELRQRMMDEWLRMNVSDAFLWDGACPMVGRPAGRRPASPARPPARRRHRGCAAA